MPDVRALFLDALERAIELVAGAAVAARWDEPSALPEFTVRGLAGHAMRSTTDVVLQYLGNPEPSEDRLLTAAQYYAAVMSPDLGSEMNIGVRERGEQFAARGHAVLIEQVRTAQATLRQQLPAEPANRRIEVIGGLRLTLDEYLVTRLVELVVHSDDLAASVDLPAAEPDPEAGALVITCVTGVARLRHGDNAVLRALTRAERDHVHPFPVF